MFSTVSWHEFLIAIIVVLVIYYTGLVLLFYRDEIIKILRDGFPKRNHNSISVTEALTVPPAKVLEGLTILFKDAARKQYHREELMQALESYLKDHSQLRGSAFEPDINNHISLSATALCDIYLEETDIRQLW